MSVGHGPEAALVNHVVAGDPAALREFGSRFGALAFELTRRLCPTADRETAQELARRALQICVDQLPHVREAVTEPGGWLAAWVAVVCDRFLHEVRAEGELDSAARSELELLPDELPDHEHFELLAYYRPAKWLSGDYYDAVVREGRDVVVLIADVMGHGAPAALMVSAVKCAFQMSAGAGSSAQVLAAMNAVLEPVLPPSSFVVASVLHLGPGAGSSILANAGMEGATVVWRSEARVEPLEVAGRPLGLFARPEYATVRRCLRSGDSFFLCTDGVRDLVNEARERFAAARLPEVLARAATGEQDLYSLLSRALDEFAPGGEWNDDACFVVARAR